MKLQFGTAAAFVAYMAMAVVAGRFLHLKGPEWYFFLGLLGALGITASSLFIYFRTKREAKSQAAQGAGGAAAPVEGGNAEINHIIREADARLAQSKQTQGAGIANLPLVFVIGDVGMAKTSTILHSGLEPELLAGLVYQENNVAPTRAANVWLARGTAFLEAGGKILGDPANWVHLVRRLQPGKLKSLVAKGTQAPRAVLLCFDIESFLRPGASEAVATTTRYLQARLGDISQTLGINFPVYVLFTKADRLPFCLDYVRNLSSEEATQVFGATVPIRPANAAGIYAEDETRRLTWFFDNLYHSLCDKRLHYLPREGDPEKLPGAYEFPREFRKLRTTIVQFLVDVCRPSQLRASPFLRGFYFSGVRPVVVADVAPTPVAPQAGQQTFEPASGATRMFRAGFQAEQLAKQATVQPQAGGRKVPEWMFLGHLFNDVLLQDHTAMGASGASVKVSGLQRILLATAAVLLLGYSLALTVSFFGNRSLEQTAITAAKNIPATDPNALPSVDSLQRLDAVRRSLDQLTTYRTDGAPLRLRWGIYAGDDMYPHVRRIYYNKFRQLLFGSTQAGLLSFLQKAPPAPGPNDDFGYAYDTLKSYLLTTSEYKRTSDKSLQTFLGSRLFAHWSANRDAEIGKDRLDLARAQFDFYSRDLPNGNPYSSDAEAASVERARIYLSKFSGVERVYQFLLSEAARRKPPVNFNQQFPGSVQAVTSTQEVSFAFTKDGYKFMQDEIRKANFGGEQWVLGSYQGQSLDKSSMERGILDLYTRDYINTWRMVLRRSSVNKYADLHDASGKLNILTGSQAPLLALMWWTTQNTAIDLPRVADAFRPVQQVVPPSVVQQYIVPPNQNYNNGLMKLQQSVDQTANSPNDPNLQRATRDDAQSATLATKQLSTTFPIDPDAHIEAVVSTLLLQPITNVDALTRGLGAGELNAKGGQFCVAFSGMSKKFPFVPNVQPEVTLQELADIFKPKEGKLWVFYDSTLKNFLQCPAGGDCVPNPNAPVQMNPVFVRFFSQAVKFSRALYGENSADPNFKYTLRPQKSDQVESFDLTVNGEAAKLAGGASHAYVWPGTSSTHDFRLSLRLAGGTPFGVQNREGLWAVFRFFADADRTSQSGAGYDFVWNFRQGQGGSAPIVNGRPLTYEFNLDTGGAPAVFSKDFLAGLKCIPTVAH